MGPACTPKRPVPNLADFTVGLVNTHYVFLPTTTIIQFARVVDPKGRWAPGLLMLVACPSPPVAFGGGHVPMCACRAPLPHPPGNGTA